MHTLVGNQRGAVARAAMLVVLARVRVVSGTESLLHLVKLSPKRRPFELRARQLHSASQAVNTTHDEADVLALEQVHGLVWTDKEPQAKVGRRGRTTNGYRAPRFFVFPRQLRGLRFRTQHTCSSSLCSMGLEFDGATRRRLDTNSFFAEGYAPLSL